MKKIIGGILILLLPVLVDAEVPWVENCSKTTNGCTSTYTQWGGNDSPTGEPYYTKHVVCYYNGVKTYEHTHFVGGTAYQYCSGWSSGSGQ